MSIKPDELKGFLTGCIEAGKALVELASRGYDCLLRPCRGAFPVLVGAIEALKSVEGGEEFLESFYAPYPHPMLEGVHRKSGDFRLLICPLRRM